MRVFSIFPVSVLLLLSGPAAAVETQLDLIVKSDASYRGIRQASDDKPVFQGLVQLALDSGLYAGVWSSRAHSQRDSRDAEVDYFIGYQRRWNENFATDLTLQHYTYHGAEFDNDYDWNELQIATHIGNHVTLLVAAGDNWIGVGERSYVFEASYRYALTHSLSAYATIGHHLAQDVIGNNYTYRELGVATMLLGFDLQLGWADTSGMSNAPFVADHNVGLSVIRRFTFR